MGRALLVLARGRSSGSICEAGGVRSSSSSSSERLRKERASSLSASSSGWFVRRSLSRISSLNSAWARSDMVGDETARGCLEEAMYENRRGKEGRAASRW